MCLLITGARPQSPAIQLLHGLFAPAEFSLNLLGPSYAARVSGPLLGWSCPCMGAQRQNYLPSDPSTAEVLAEARWLQNRRFSVETI